MSRIDTSKFDRNDFILDKKQADLLLTKFLREIANGKKGKSQYNVALDLIGYLKIELDSMKEFLKEIKIFHLYEKIRHDKIPQLEILWGNLELFDEVWKKIPIRFGDYFE